MTETQKVPFLKNQMDDPLRACVHCGLCLEVCPTYKLTFDENNSPRGRLRLWRDEAVGLIPEEESTAFYTSECVGCLACEPVCPANVPYSSLLEQTRLAHAANGRYQPKASLRLAAGVIRKPAMFNRLMAPVRALRKASLLPHPLVFQGAPAIFKSTQQYAQELMSQHRPSGPRVALLTGCLMEAMFREINFATVRVLIAHNVQVFIPQDQGCCGAFQEHAGIEGVVELRKRNQSVFHGLDVDCVLANSAGCGLALKHALEPEMLVRDVLDFLAELELNPLPPKSGPHVYVDLPCHLVHGQRSPGISRSVLDATGYDWELAPCARDCCGSGGIYNIQKKENARQILQDKSNFLKEAQGDPVILATANHVCMMQWNSAHSLVKRPFKVRHVIQLLDPLTVNGASSLNINPT